MTNSTTVQAERSTALGQWCQMGRCPNAATNVLHACGIFYLCDRCRASVDRLACLYDGGEVL